MAIEPRNLVRHELIGLEIRVSESANPSQKGLSGKVIDETYNTIRLETKEGEEKTVIKRNCVFIFTLPNKTKVEVDGKVLVARPEDRIKKKFAKW